MAKLVTAAAAILAILVFAFAYTPAPISTLAGIILAYLLHLLVNQPLALVAVLMLLVFVGDDKDTGLFDDIFEAWFLLGALEWLWLGLKWLWLGLKWSVIMIKHMLSKTSSARKHKRQDTPPFDRES